MRTLKEIRQTFLGYFEKNGHEVVPSSGLVPENDPTLMFTNAGMNQFKDVFTGKEQRSYTRAVSSQKCLRAGGKHNDLDNVGYTGRHHTFFEMLGNFSFGDYFKEEAIYHAWQVVTKELALDATRLLVTVYHDDQEAAALWKKIAGLSDEKIIRIATSDNFWMMGDTGPCGPCSEIFYDHGDKVAGGPPGSADQDGDRFVEIWNLVFMQYNQQVGGDRALLPRPSIDTGMGLERITAVLQGKHNNFDTDLFQTIIRTSEEFTKNRNSAQRQSHNVIADHLRASSFLIADGVLPSNEGRGYVLRRIMRRGMRHAHLLGAAEPLMHRLVSPLTSLMGEAYPELMRAQTLIEQTLKQEEERFRQTLARGLSLLQESLLELEQTAPLPGAVAFKLYDTYGFPLDLTQDVLRAQNRTVDQVEFDACMQKQKEQARAAWAGSGDAVNEKIWFDLREAHGATEFLGYTTHHNEGVVQALIKDGTCVDQVQSGDTVMMLINQTCFYAESGGQTGDTGSIKTADGAIFKVTDTLKKVGALHLHVGIVEQGNFSVTIPVKLDIDLNHRRQVAANHSATHLLHAALRRILGTHVTQKGSLVEAERLRFDFTHASALTAEQIKVVEHAVNQQILNNSETHTHVMTPEAAIEAGAMALFGERYGDEVRVVQMGTKSFSKELCGGTHVKRTGDIGLFKIISEGSVSAGVRRIEAITGQQILQMMDTVVQTLETEREAAKKLTRDLQKQVAHLKSSLALGKTENAAATPQQLGAYKAFVRHLDGVDIKDMKALADQLKKEIGSGLVVITARTEEKLSIVIGVTTDLTPYVSAADLVKKAAVAVNGQGGGRADLAQAGGTLTDVAQLDQLMLLLEEHLKSKAA